MKCPHCGVHFHECRRFDWIHEETPVGEVDAVPARWAVSTSVCPACEGPILYLLLNPLGVDGGEMIYPRSSRRAPADVPRHVAQDFDEAASVLALSPKASAALSRRCLQALLRDQGFEQHDLARAIDAALESMALPVGLASSLNAVRTIGNFAAHPVKSDETGLIVEVEPDEAEWNLDVLEGLFEFYYVNAARDNARVHSLNSKLAAAGRPPLKGTT